MSIVNLDVTCPGCGPTPLMKIRGGDLSAWQRTLAAGQHGDLPCSSCGATYALSDLGGSIGQAETTKPCLESASPATGPAAGGTAITLTGRHFDVGTLTVTVGGVACTPRAVTATTAVVDTPPAPPATAGTPVEIAVRNGNGSCAEGRIFPGFTYA